MLEGKALDQFMDRFFGDSCAQSLPGEEESGQELEEYELKEDGIIIQPIHKGKIEKRTWIGLIMFLAFVPLVLFILVHKFHGCGLYKGSAERMYSFNTASLMCRPPFRS